MRSMVWQLVYVLLGLLGYPIVAFVLLLLLHVIAKLASDARVVALSHLFLLLEWPEKLRLIRFLLWLLGFWIAAFVLPLLLVYKLAEPIILSLLLLLLEWPENLRHHLIRATRTLHRPPPCTSRLLLLPPELRQPIWTILLADPKYVHIRDLAPRFYTSYVEQLRLYMGINPEYSTIWFSMEPIPRHLQLHIAFIQTCRQIYNEASYDLYSNKIFYFTEAKALVSWIRNLSPAQKRDVRDIRINMPNNFFNHSGITASSLTRDAVQVRFAMEELRGLRKLSIWFWTNHWLHTTKHEAQGVYQLVANVKVFEVLIVQLAEETVGSEDAHWTEVGWPAHSQEEFACAVWARIRNPGSALEQRVQVEQGSRARFVLKVKK